MVVGRGLARHCNINIISAELRSPSANTLRSQLMKLLDEAEESQFPVVACVDFEISPRWVQVDEFEEHEDGLRQV